MAFRSTVLRPFARLIARRVARWAAEPLAAQQRVLEELVAVGSRTAFGRDHQFKKFKNSSAEELQTQFRDHVPIRDYEGLRTYIDRIKAGERDVLWRGKPQYFAKTSGTTSGVKYIPLTRESLPNHFGSARDALFNFGARTNDLSFTDGKLIFLSGSPELEEVGGIPTGRLSGIVNHQVPAWLRTNQMPSYTTNCIEDWETKLNAIVRETLNSNMTLISGIPPWVQMYYERLLEVSGKKYVKDIFPNFSTFVYGGVNFEPYRSGLEALVGRRLASVETYPASEGFIAFQDQPANPDGQHAGLLLNVASGIYFEFVRADEINNANAPRLSLREVQLGENYALIINNNAGLWGYNIGDTVEFVSLNPYRIRVTGRVKHFISAFGEHVIGKEVETAILTVANAVGVRVVEFTVAPQIAPLEGGLPYHEWFVELDNAPDDLAQFALHIDMEMRKQNIYYDDLIRGNILRTLRITPLRRDAFRDYMKGQGKLGGQNKVPRLSNDRLLASALEAYKL